MHLLSGLIRKEPFTKDLGADKGYMWVIELAEVIKDFQSGEKSYTNYKAILFAKTISHIKFNNENLVKGSFVVIQCDKIKVEKYQPENSNDIRVTLLMENARLNDVMAPQIQQQGQQQGGFQQQGQQQGGFQQQ